MLSSLYNKACLVEYLGAKYAGWQRQKNADSIQSIIENKLSKMYNEPILSIGSGRTDKGVHSFGQVFNYKSARYIPNDKVMRGLNSLLPDDIKIIDAIDVPDDFNSLHHSVAKTYAYKIINRTYPIAIDFDHALWVRENIDTALLNKTLNAFVGEHDFASFCVTKSKKENTVRKINYIDMLLSDQKIIIAINANGFLHNMVRVIVGTSLDIAINGKNIDTVNEIMEKKDRRVASKTAPATALYHIKTYYNNGIFDTDENRLISRL